MNLTKIIRDKPDLKFVLNVGYVVAEQEMKLSFREGYRELKRVIDFTVSKLGYEPLGNFSNFGNYLQMILPTPNIYKVEVLKRNTTRYIPVSAPYQDITFFQASFAIALLDKGDEGDKDQQELLMSLEEEQQ